MSKPMLGNPQNTIEVIQKYEFKFQHVSIDQEVLPKFLLKIKIIFLQHRDGVLRNSQICHVFSFSVILINVCFAKSPVKIFLINPLSNT